jgi:uncharacterized protein YdeI (YjbR/CyaY-like superfamily)
VTETLKWRTPTFDHKGIMIGMATFKHYTTMAFWKSKLVAERLSTADRAALKQAEEVKHGEKLPNRATLVRLIKVAAQLNEEGVTLTRVVRARPPLKTPAFLTDALKKHPKAQSVFDAFPPSHKRDYVEWLADAKQDETRQRRLDQALQWMAEGKSRNWKYEKRS